MRRARSPRAPCRASHRAPVTAVAAALLSAAVALAGCTLQPRAAPVPSEPLPARPAPPPGPEPPPGTPEWYDYHAEELAVGALRPESPAAPLPRPGPLQASPVTARLSADPVAPDLSNVTIAPALTPLPPALGERLAIQGFAAVPSDSIQPFTLYQENHSRQIPSFITTDSVLHTFHLFYDSALRGVEYWQLYPLLEEFAGKALTAQVALYESARHRVVREAALNNIVYLAVPARLLGLEAEVPQAAAARVEAELARVQAHAGREEMTFLPYSLDYTQFKPRGHYTRTQQFQRYFQAMMWYGLVPFALEAETDPATGYQKVDAAGALRAARQALLLTATMDEELDRLWEQLDATTALFVGHSDDLHHRDLRAVAGSLWGKSSPDIAASDREMAAFIAGVADRLPPPGIAQQIWDVPTGRQFRMLGQRFAIDSAVLQGLVRWPERPVPDGLDIPAAFGSPRAEEYLIERMGEGRKWLEYPGRLRQQQERVAALAPEDWTASLYSGWLWSLLPLLEPKGAGYPAFMRSAAWQDKSLTTTLGSWAELRHDSVLYAKPSFAAGAGRPEPGRPPGYVEPEPEVYARLGWLTRHALAELTARGLLDERMARSGRTLAELLDWLQAVARKELAGEPLSEQELERIDYYGRELEGLSAFLASGGMTGSWLEIPAETDRDMAVVVDVHNTEQGAWEVAVGRPYALYVVVPHGDRLVLTRGAAFSYFQFMTPAGDRMTDADWQQLHRSPQAPPPPDWTGSYLLPGLADPATAGR